MKNRIPNFVSKTPSIKVSLRAASSFEHKQLLEYRLEEIGSKKNCIFKIFLKQCAIQNLKYRNDNC